MHPASIAVGVLTGLEGGRDTMSPKKLKMTEPPQEQTLGEEIANSVIHGVGAALAIAATVLLIVFSVIGGDPWRIIGTSIFGATLIILYLTSTLYHSLAATQAAPLFKTLDHAAIYLLIAGTYTPITLKLGGPWGWSMFGLIWALAIGGVVFKFFFISRFEFATVIVYILMGWLCLIALDPIVETLSAPMIAWLVIGGASYTLGVVFYIWRRLPYNHAIWHVFVLGGSISHFVAIMFFL